MLKKIMALLGVLGALFSFTGCGNKPDDSSSSVQEFNRWDVTLVSFDSGSKIKVIKEIMNLKDIGLAEAKEISESVPVVIATGKSTDDAQEIKAKFEKIGAVIGLSPTKKAAKGADGNAEYYDIRLVSFDEDRKMSVITAITKQAHISLAEARKLVDTAPTTILTDVPAADVKNIKAALEDAGAKIELVPLK
ncbi:MAG: ribosomal protein L7/L12 [[Eubacterium] saphenum]|nr:ribosomal protein L7/L12 [[Eubacterium] saphenum]